MANARRAVRAPAYAPAMVLGRVLSRWQWLAAAVLPLWLLIGYAVWGDSFGGFLSILLLAPVVLVVEAGLALLFSARRRVAAGGAAVRRHLDAPALVSLSAFQAGVVGIGFFGPATPWFAVLAAVAAIGGAWWGGRLLVRDVRRRVDDLRAPAGRRPLDAGEYVVVKPTAR